MSTQMSDIPPLRPVPSDDDGPEEEREAERQAEEELRRAMRGHPSNGSKKSSRRDPPEDLPQDSSIEGDQADDESSETDLEDILPSEPWKPFPHESSRHYRLFQTYRDLGPERSLSKVVEKWKGVDGASESTLFKLSSRWRWVDRARAWDHHQANLQLKGLESRIVQDAETSLDEADSMWAKAQDILREAEAKGKVDPKDAIALMKIAKDIKHESFARLRSYEDEDDAMFRVRVGAEKAISLALSLMDEDAKEKFVQGMAAIREEIDQGMVAKAIDVNPVQKELESDAEVGDR